jgi:AcrR family transcriptional regulator
MNSVINPEGEPMAANQSKRTNARRRPADSQQPPTADRLIALAAHHFRTNGFHATTTRELSKALGIEKSSLYYHVSSKDSLLYQICVESLNSIRDAVAGALEKIEDPGERVATLISSHVQTMLRDRDLHATMLIELRALTGTNRDEVIVLRDGYESLVRETIGEAQAAGALTRDFTAHELTLSLLNLLNWTIFWYRPDGPDSAERLESLFSHIFLEGAATNADQGKKKKSVPKPRRAVVGR